MLSHSSKIEQLLLSKKLQKPEKVSCSLLDRFSYYIFESVDSTMTVSQELLSELGRLKYCDALLKSSGSCANLDTVVIAGEQTKGKGTKDRTWCSAPNVGIYLTLSYYLPSRSVLQTSIALIIGCALHKTLKRFNVESRLKWPNDVLVYSHKENIWRKIAGVLIESSTQGDKEPNNVRIGIGLNVNQDSFSKNVLGISMAQVAGINFELSHVLTDLIWEVNAAVDYYLHKGFCAYKEQWIKCSMMFEKTFIMHSDANHDIIHVQCQGITDDGALIVQTLGASPQIIKVYSGEFEIVKHSYC